MSIKKIPASATNETDELIGRLLSRIAAILVRLGWDSPKSERLLRNAFVHAAHMRVRSTEKRPTQSRIASVAGLSRLEVRTILRGKAKVSSAQASRIDQVIIGWRSDPYFLDARGKPKHLTMRGSGVTFDSLAKKYGRDVTSRTLREALIQRGFAAVKKKKLVLLQGHGKYSEDALAAHADLKFLASHLNAIDFQLGRRSYVIRQSTIAADHKRAVEMLKRIAITRLDTVFSSLAAMSEDARGVPKQKRVQSRRLHVTAIVASEAEDRKT